MTLLQEDIRLEIVKLAFEMFKYKKQRSVNVDISEIIQSIEDYVYHGDESKIKL